MNAVKAFPDQTPPHLFSLTLAFNRLTAEPAEFPDQLLFVSLAKNSRLTYLPDLGKCLMRLDASGCKLASGVSDILSQYPLLTKLNLSSCSLTSFGTCEFFCPFLCELLLASNELTEVILPVPMPSLALLRVDCNYELTCLDVGYAPALRTLDVSFTQVANLANIDRRRVDVVCTDAPVVFREHANVTDLRAAFFWRSPDDCPMFKATKRQLDLVTQRILQVDSRSVRGFIKRSWEVEKLRHLAVSAYNEVVSSGTRVLRTEISVTHPLLIAANKIVTFLRAAVVKRRQRIPPLALNKPERPTMATATAVAAAPPPLAARKVAKPAIGRQEPRKPSKTPPKPGVTGSKQVKLTAQESVAAYFSKLSKSSN